MEISKLITAYSPLDPYDRVARLIPALLAISPIIVLFDCLYGTSNPLLSMLVSVFGVCGGGYAMARAARNAGYRIQDKLFAKWGGKPTTQLLRHRNSQIDGHTKARCHSILAAALKKPFPRPAEETANPEAADDLYRAGTEWLKAQTKDTKQFPSVFRENIAFGFQRNMLGLRAAGVVIILAALLGGLLADEAFRASSSFNVSLIVNAKLAVKISVLFSAAMLAAWLFIFTEPAARRTAFAYAERLILSCDEIGASGKGSPRKAKEANTA